MKDTLAYMRLLANPCDDSAFERVINFPTRGIGEKTLDELRSLARTEQIPLWQAATQLLKTCQMTQRAAAALSYFM